jgi:hypothetical protein
MIRRSARQFANPGWRWVPAAALAIGIGSHEAGAESIPFSLHNENPTEARCVSCSGPWARTTNWNLVDANTNREFYEAEANLFSPFGEWSCQIAALNEGGCNFEFIDPVPVIAGRVFCLPNPPTTPSVQLTLTPDPPRLHANYPNGDCDSSAATSFLGDNAAARASRSGRGGKLSVDEDSFGLAADAGDELQIRFAGHEHDGYQDGTATLVLLAEDGAVVDQVEGAPPLDLVVVVPQGGDYLIVVQQAGAGDDAAAGPFRGTYRLSLVSSGATPLLAPDPDVEP